MASSYVDVKELPGLRESCDMEDVTFSFNETGTNGKKEVKANKTILSLASKVFKTQFFGSIPAGRVVHVEDSSINAFEVFIDALYDVKIEFKEMNLMHLGELFFLAEKYQVDAMKVAILENVKTREIELDDVIDVVKVGEANKHLVEFVEALDVLCVKFVRSISTSKLSELVSMSQAEEAPVLYQLLSKVHKLKDNDEVKVIKKCTNCQQDPCITGRSVTIENFVEGAQYTKGWGPLGITVYVGSKTSESTFQFRIILGAEGRTNMSYNGVRKLKDYKFKCK